MLYRLISWVRFTSIGYLIRSIRAQVELFRWNRSKKDFAAPHILKRRLITQFADEFHTRVLVESGTYLGDMVYALRRRFDRIFSIELEKTLYEKAQKRFARHKHISIIHGDSGQALKEVMEDINERCLFWLDAHYSGGFTARGKSDSPIQDEIKEILCHHVKNHVILIDDARMFKGDGGYPTIEDLEKTIQMQCRAFQLQIVDDVICISLQDKFGVGS